MFIPINEIRTGKRIRIDEGDLFALMNSLKKFGQLNPIILDSRKRLIAGARRLEAAKRLGWNTIKAIIIEDPTEIEKIEIELEENIQRKELTGEEVARGMKRLEKLYHPNIFMRIWFSIKRFFRRIFGKRRRI